MYIKKGGNTGSKIVFDFMDVGLYSQKQGWRLYGNRNRVYPIRRPLFFFLFVLLLNFFQIIKLCSLAIIGIFCSVFVLFYVNANTSATRKKKLCRIILRILPCKIVLNINRYDMIRNHRYDGRIQWVIRAIPWSLNNEF